MKDFEKIKNGLAHHLTNEIDYTDGDLSDIGNEIGYFIGKYLSKDFGMSMEDFIHGFKHGVSVINGTH